MQIKKLIPEYLNYLRTIGRSKETTRSTKNYLLMFLVSLQESGIDKIEDIDTAAMADYQEYLAWYITKRSSLLKISTQSLALTIAKGFCRWLVESDYLVSDPAKNIRLPRLPKRLPRNILDIREIKKLITKPDTQTTGGYRDRLVLELLYSTGIPQNRMFKHQDRRCGL